MLRHLLLIVLLRRTLLLHHSFTMLPVFNSHSALLGILPLDWNF